MSVSTLTAPQRTCPLTTLRWIARIASIASLGIILMFAFGEPGKPTASEWLLLAFFPIGVAVGMVVGWWRALLGGMITLASLAVFYIVIFAFRGNIAIGPYFVILSAPGAAFLAVGMWERAKRVR